ncbi:hypothetical protein SDJN02_07750, partial [Cucurbita argyrosperma subsp. argyrosperma]
MLDLIFARGTKVNPTPYFTAQTTILKWNDATVPTATRSSKFVPGAVSKTASFLRLWALRSKFLSLSQAHSEFLSVFYDKFDHPNGVGIAIFHLCNCRSFTSSKRFPARLGAPLGGVSEEIIYNRWIQISPFSFSLHREKDE